MNEELVYDSLNQRSIIFNAIKWSFCHILIQAPINLISTTSWLLFQINNKPQLVPSFCQTKLSQLFYTYDVECVSKITINHHPFYQWTNCIPTSCSCSFIFKIQPASLIFWCLTAFLVCIFHILRFVVMKIYILYWQQLKYIDVDNQNSIAEWFQKYTTLL